MALRDEVVLLMNVIDDQKLQSALTGVTDSAVRGLTTQVLPVLGALVDSAVEKLSRELELVVGDTLADLTAERTETVNDLHDLLTRLNGAAVHLTIPERKQI